MGEWKWIKCLLLASHDMKESAKIQKSAKKKILRNHQALMGERLMLVSLTNWCNYGN